MNGEYSKFNLLPVWTKYLDFESFARREDGDLKSFISEWEVKMAEAQSVGCRYSDLVLALKLIEKANLGVDPTESIILKLGPTQKNDLLRQVVSALQHQNKDTRSFKKLTKDELSENIIKFEGDSGMYPKQEENEDDNFVHQSDNENIEIVNGKRNEHLKIRGKISRKSVRHRCPDCCSNLKPHQDYASGDVLCCSLCESVVVVNKRPRSRGTAKLVVLPKCLQCGEESLVPSKDSRVSGQRFHGEDSLVCPTCDLDDMPNFPQVERKLKQHCSKRSASKQSDQKFGCIKCYKVFSSFAELESHSRTHQSDSTCKVCNTDFRNKVAFAKHTKQVHPDGEIDLKSSKDTQKKSSFLNCPICDKRFMLMGTLEKHIKDHSDQEKQASASSMTHDVNVLDKQESLRSGLKLAERVLDDAESGGEASENSVKSFGCSQCGEIFSQGIALTTHLKTSHSCRSSVDQIKNALKCDVCATRFTSSEALAEHVKSNAECFNHNFLAATIKEEGSAQVESMLGRRKQVVGNTLIKKCDKIKFGSLNAVHEMVKAEDLKSLTMVKDCSNKSSNKVPCEVCGKFFSVANVKAHVATHTASREFGCPVCHKHFATRQRLKIHANVHKAKRDLICSFCGKGFKTKATLNDHINLHTKAKAFDCSTCGKQFFSHNSLRLHIRVHHTGEKPYKCDFCDLTFYTSSKRMDHMRVHTGEKPFSCDVCGKQFGDRSSRKRHLKNVHCAKSNDRLPSDVVESENFF